MEEKIPEFFEKISGYFSRKGAYSRYKDLLEEIGMLDKWYEFEASKTKAALLEWCEENGLEFEE